MAATEAAREMALAELLGEVDRDVAKDARVARDCGAHSAPLDLDLGNLDITTGAETRTKRRSRGSASASATPRVR